MDEGGKKQESTVYPGRASARRTFPPDVHLLTKDLCKSYLFTSVYAKV
jgi:hypothetical protein